jgi:cAMP phosphodiesterase
MMKCGVLFEVRTEFLNVIYKSCGFKGLNVSITHVKSAPKSHLMI